MAASPLTPVAGQPPVELHTKDVQLSASVPELREAYRLASPFPHVVFDNLWSSELIEGVCKEIPAVSERDYLHHDDEHQERFCLRSAAQLGEHGRALVAILQSASFLYLLSEITGIWGLLPDPYLQGSGYHVAPRGSKFDVHLDRKTDYVFGLRRRLALITYLNPDWKPEYGGQLELWNSSGTRREQSFDPIFNRTVVFAVDDGCYHGNPSVVACPPGRSRNSFLSYYHTMPEDGRSRVDLISSVFAPPQYQRFRFRSIARQLTPPILFKAIKRLQSGADSHRI